MRYKNIAIIAALVIFLSAGVGVTVWAMGRGNDEEVKELNTIDVTDDADAEEEEAKTYNFTITTPAPSSSKTTTTGNTDSANTTTVGDTTITEEEDGSYTINPDWGESPDPDDDAGDVDATANIGSGGSEIELADDGAYYGEATDSTGSTSSSGGSTPQHGDTRIDENGVTWRYYSYPGVWVEVGAELGGQLESKSDAIPGTGETVGVMG